MIDRKTIYAIRKDWGSAVRWGCTFAQMNACWRGEDELGGMLGGGMDMFPDEHAAFYIEDMCCTEDDKEMQRLPLWRHLDLDLLGDGEKKRLQDRWKGASHPMKACELASALGLGDKAAALVRMHDMPVLHKYGELGEGLVQEARTFLEGLGCDERERAISYLSVERNGEGDLPGERRDAVQQLGARRGSMLVMDRHDRLMRIALRLPAPSGDFIAGMERLLGHGHGAVDAAKLNLHGEHVSSDEAWAALDRLTLPGIHSALDGMSPSLASRMLAQVLCVAAIAMGGRPICHKKLKGIRRALSLSPEITFSLGRRDIGGPFRISPVSIGGLHVELAGALTAD